MDTKSTMLLSAAFIYLVFLSSVQGTKPKNSWTQGRFSHRHLSGKLSLSAGAQSTSDQHVSTAPSNAVSHSHASSHGEGIAVSDSLSKAENGGSAFSSSGSTATGQGTSISGAFSETEVDGTASLLADAAADVEATTTALAESSKGITRVESRGVARAKASASSTIVVEITAAISEILGGETDFISTAGKSSRAIGEAIAGAFAGAETSASVGGVGLGSGYASAETRSIATASAIAVTRAVNLVSNGKAAAFTASQAEGLSVAVAEALSKAEASASTFFGAASAKRTQLTEAIAQPVVEVLATALVKLTEDLSEAESIARVTSYTVGDGHSTAYASTSATGDTSGAGSVGEGSGSVGKSSIAGGEETLDMISSDVSTAGQNGLDIQGQNLTASTSVGVRSVDGLAEAEAKSNSKINVQVRNSVANLVAKSVSYIVGDENADAEVEAQVKALAIADAIVTASTSVEISLSVDGEGSASARTSAIAQAAVITAARTIVTAIAAAINDKFDVKEVVTIESLSAALVEASATSQAQAAIDGGTAEARHQTVATALAEVISAALARVFVKIADTFHERRVLSFVDTFSTGDAHVTTDSFTSLDHSFGGGVVLASGGGFADFKSDRPCTGVKHDCCKTAFYNKGYCMCSEDIGFETCEMELMNLQETPKVWITTKTGERCIC